MQAKPVQIAVIVIGLLIGVVGIVLAVSKSGSPQTAASVMLVDVTTGEMFDAGTKKRTLVLPMEHPETGANTLMRVGYDEARDGYYIDPRHMKSLEQVEGEVVRVDLDSGRVEVDDSSKPKKM